MIPTLIGLVFIEWVLLLRESQHLVSGAKR